jgi:AraC-like DNA-binding protein
MIEAQSAGCAGFCGMTPFETPTEWHPTIGKGVRIQIALLPEAPHGFRVPDFNGQPMGLSAGLLGEENREDTGQTQAEFVVSIRLKEARRLLEETDLAPKVIAQRCGLGSAMTMRRVFVREIRVSAADYRGRFYAQVARAAAVPSFLSTAPPM